MTNPLLGWSVDPSTITTTGHGLRRPECILAERSGDLWIADLGGIVHLDAHGTQRLIRPDGGGPFAPGTDPNIEGNEGYSLPNGLCFDTDGNFVVANFGTNRIEHITRDGTWSLVADRATWPDGVVRPLGKANFPSLDREGRLWFSVTASAEAWRSRSAGLQPDGYIAVIDDWKPGIRTVARVVATGLCGTNEMRFDADGSTLLVAETGADHLTRFTVEAGGVLSGRETFGPEKLHGAPDGFAFDAHGNVWTTLIGQDTLVAITPEGDLLTLWEDGDRDAKNSMRTGPGDLVATIGGTRPGDGLAPRMASVTFGGPDLTTVYVGSLEGSSLPTFKSPIPGAPLPHWSRTASDTA